MSPVNDTHASAARNVTLAKALKLALIGYFISVVLIVVDCCIAAKAYTTSHYTANTALNCVVITLAATAALYRSTRLTVTVVQGRLIEHAARRAESDY